MVRKQGDGIAVSPPSSLLRDGQSAQDREIEKDVQRNRSAESRATATVFSDEDSDNNDTEEGTGSMAWQDSYLSFCCLSSTRASDGFEDTTTSYELLKLIHHILRNWYGHSGTTTASRNERRGIVLKLTGLPCKCTARCTHGSWKVPTIT